MVEGVTFRLTPLSRTVYHGIFGEKTMRVHSSRISAVAQKVFRSRRAFNFKVDRRIRNQMLEFKRVVERECGCGCSWVHLASQSTAAAPVAPHRLDYGLNFFTGIGTSALLPAAFDEPPSSYAMLPPSYAQTEALSFAMGAVLHASALRLLPDRSCWRRALSHPSKDSRGLRLPFIGGK